MKSGKETSGEQQNEIDVWSWPSHPFTSQHGAPPKPVAMCSGAVAGEGLPALWCLVGFHENFCKKSYYNETAPQNLLGVVRFRLKKDVGMLDFVQSTEVRQRPNEF